MFKRKLLVKQTLDLTLIQQPPCSQDHSPVHESKSTQPAPLHQHLLNQHYRQSAQEMLHDPSLDNTLDQRKLALQNELHLMRAKNKQPINHQSKDFLAQVSKPERDGKRMGPTQEINQQRATCRFDYDLSRCKDYHDTGSCVFGNSCIYLHDRGDYKTGWELEEDYRKEQLALHKAKYQPTPSPQKSEPNNSCPICNKPLEMPIQTICLHIFCENCAIKRYRDDPCCAVCGENTQGMFNAAQSIQGQAHKKIKLNYNSIQTPSSSSDGTLDQAEKDFYMQDVEILKAEFEEQQKQSKVRTLHESDWIIR